MGKLHWNDRQQHWQGTSGDALVTLSDETMQTLIEQDLTRYGGTPTEEERIAAKNRWLNVDRYALPIEGVNVERAARSGDVPRQLRGAKD